MFKLVLVLLFLSTSLSAHYVSGCKIYDNNGVEIRNFQDAYCLYLENGELIKFDFEKNKIKKLDSFLNIKWQKNLNFHHQAKLSKDLNRIISLDKNYITIFGVKVLVDQISVFNTKNGKILHSFNLFNDRKNTPNITKIYNHNTDKYIFGTTLDTTHANSIYEIDKNANETKDPRFKSGNWIYNPMFSGKIFFLSPDLKEIIGTIELPEKITGPIIHDVQVLPNGQILLYANNAPDSKSALGHSSLFTFDPFNPMKVFSEKILQNDAAPFTQNVAGGIQFLPDGSSVVSVYSDKNGYQFVKYDNKGKESLRVTPYPNEKNWGQVFQDAKIIDLSNFLKKNTGEF